MNKKQTRKVNVIPNNFSMKILERFLPQEEINKLIIHYKEAKSHTRTGSGLPNREVNLKKQVTDFEKVALDHYMHHSEVPMRQFAKQTGHSVAHCTSAAYRCATKIVYQNADRLKDVIRK